MTRHRASETERPRDGACPAGDDCASASCLVHGRRADDVQELTREERIALCDATTGDDCHAQDCPKHEGTVHLCNVPGCEKTAHERAKSPRGKRG